MDTISELKKAQETLKEAISAGNSGLKGALENITKAIEEEVRKKEEKEKELINETVKVETAKRVNSQGEKEHKKNVTFLESAYAHLFNYEEKVNPDAVTTVKVETVKRVNSQGEKGSANGYYPGKSFFDGIVYES